MKIITVKLPEQFLEAMDELVNTGRYETRSEVIRAAIGTLLERSYGLKIDDEGWYS